MKTMHVVQLGPVPPPEGGVSRNIIAIRDELIQQGHRCTLIATTSGGSNEEGIFRPRTPAALIKLLATLDFDILHLHIGGDVNRRVLGLALAASQFARGRSILTLHSGAFPLSETAKNAKRLSLAGTVFRSFSRLVAVNDAIADVFHRFGVAAERIEIIVPFSPQFPDPSVSVSSELADFVSAASPFLLSVGGLEPDYDPLFQIESMTTILKRHHDARLMIVGDGSLRAEADATIAELGLRGRIMLAGNVPHEQVLHLIDKADVMLRTTLFDGDAISVREALHLRTPVIATDNGMRPEGVHLLSERTANELANIVNVALKASSVASDFIDDGIAGVVAIYKRLATS